MWKISEHIIDFWKNIINEKRRASTFFCTDCKSRKYKFWNWYYDNINPLPPEDGKYFVFRPLEEKQVKKDIDEYRRNVKEYKENADSKEALAGFEKLAKKGYPAAQFSLGVMHVNGEGGLKQNEVKARELFEKAAEKGEADAQKMLDIMAALCICI